MLEDTNLGHFSIHSVEGVPSLVGSETYFSEKKNSNILEVRNLVWILDFSHEFPNSGLPKHDFLSEM